MHARSHVSLLKPARPTLLGTYDVKERSVAPLPDATVRRALAVAEAMFASEEGPPPAERLDWVGSELRGFLGHSGPDAQRVFRLCLFAVTVLGPLWSWQIGYVGRELSERRRQLDRVERSLLATALFGLKAVLCLLYFEHPDAARDNGATGGCKIEVQK